MSDPIFKSGELSFHGIDYLIRISSSESSLSIEIEQKNSGETWKNAFSADYIEEITQKTGNFKKFSVFLKMLMTSLGKNSDSVFLDILTYQDLQVLKARKMGNNSVSQNSQSSGNTAGNNKRYLILTYVVEFDKVHYPLPLNFNETPDVESLKNTIRRLRTEIEEMGKLNKVGTSTGNSFFSAQEKENKENVINSLKLENEFLRQKVKKNEEDGCQRKGAVEFDMIIKAKIELETELETLKSMHLREVARLTQQNSDLQNELQAKKQEILRLQHDFASSLPQTDPNKRLTDHILKMNEESESELFSAKKTLGRQEREMERLVSEIENFRQADKKQKLRIKQLEMDLENAMKKTNIKGISDRLFSGNSRSRGNSPALSSSKRSVSVPQKPHFSRKNSSNMSTLSNKGKYSRENSINSENSGFVSRWKGKSPTLGQKAGKKSANLTPVRKPYENKQTSGVSKKMPSFSNKLGNQRKSPQNTNTNNAHNANKKSYEKPWLHNNTNSVKKNSPLPKLSKPVGSKNPGSTKKLSEEEALNSKLEELRQKNRKREAEPRETNKENTNNIDERLNKLQNLLKIAKN